MLIKVYHQNGKVKVTKTNGYREVPMFSNVSDGEVVEIEINTNTSTTSHKEKVVKYETGGRCFD